MKELLSQEIKIDFSKKLQISEDKIKQYIHQWPEQIYEIIIMLQNTKDLTHYIYHLPSNEGVLEFNLNNYTQKVDISFHNRNNLKFQRKFKHLLKKVYEDISRDDILSKELSTEYVDDMEQLFKNT